MIEVVVVGEEGGLTPSIVSATFCCSGVRISLKSVAGPRFEVVDESCWEISAI